MTAAYLAETAVQAGLRAQLLAVADIGWDPDAREFVDGSNMGIDSLFKLYPWEWLIHEPFAQYLPKAKTQFIELPWKMILSNKGILAILWDLFPGHPNLLSAFFNEPNGMFEYVKKPLLSREGANVTVHTMKGTSSQRRVARRVRLPAVGADSGFWREKGRCSAVGLLGRRRAGWEFERRTGG